MTTEKMIRNTKDALAWVDVHATGQAHEMLTFMLEERSEVLEHLKETFAGEHMGMRVDDIAALITQERNQLRQQLVDARAQLAAVRAAMNPAPYTSLDVVADLLDAVPVTNWESRYAAALGFAIGCFRRQHKINDTYAPQPAPAPASELVEALRTVYDAVVQCDLQSDMLEAYKAPYDDTVHTDHPNFAALNDWAYLSNAFDLLWEHRKAAEALKAAE